MEVGAVKQAFNNELILLKKKLNQAKIQIIHKLTRKAKTFVEKKAPEKIKEKFKRKAEAAVNEVLIIKKIKPKDLARFIVTHKGELNTYLNKPNVDQDKACARLLLHKSLQDKYKFLRDRFSSVPIEDLLMSRDERKKLKKEAREKQKNKKKGKSDSKVVNAEGDWDVEDVEIPAVKNKISDEDMSNNEDDISEDGQSSDDDNNQGNESGESEGPEDNDDVNGEESEDDKEDVIENESSSGSNDDNEIESDDDDNSGDDEKVNNLGQFVKATPEKTLNKPHILSPKTLEVKTSLKPKDVKIVEKKSKDKNKQDKNKNLNEKLLSRKFKKDISETPAQEMKVVDPFFITSTGENYMSVVEPRQPDEVKEEHMQGNRKLRRAAMFGHVPKIKPRRDDFGPDKRFNRNNNSFNKNDSFNKNEGFKKFNSSDSGDKRSFTDKRNNFNRNRHEEAKPEKEEKLHPSWEAKKKKSGILPFQGKKIVFDES